jgi:hypothetical protein
LCDDVGRRPTAGAHFHAALAIEPLLNRAPHAIYTIAAGGYDFSG